MDVPLCQLCSGSQSFFSVSMDGWQGQFQSSVDRNGDLCITGVYALPDQTFDLQSLASQPASLQMLASQPVNLQMLPSQPANRQVASCLPGSFARCANKKCPCTAWNGLEGEHCSPKCKKGTPCSNNDHPRPTMLPSTWFAACANPQCKCTASWNGLQDQCCSRACKAGSPCSYNKHPTPIKPDATLYASCANPHCPCLASWNGKAEEHCCKPCASGTPCPKPTHNVPAVAAPLQGNKFFPCANYPTCPCTASFSGKAGDHCCKNCKRGRPCSWNAHPAPLQKGVNRCLGGCGKETFDKQPGGFCGKACRQKYASNMPPKPLSDFHAIRAHGEFWARSVWSAFEYSFLKFYKNPGLDDNSCPARMKFLAGLTELRLTGADTTHAEFGWHGTGSKEAVRSICWHGLNPSFRRGQSFGPGEYFSVAATDSVMYAGTVGYLIVFLLIECSQKKSAFGNYRVVNNPVAGNPMYCLPVGVVDYMNGVDPMLQVTASSV